MYCNSCFTVWFVVRLLGLRSRDMTNLLKSVVRETLRIGAIAAQHHFVQGLQHFLTIELGQTLQAVRTARNPVQDKVRGRRHHAITLCLGP